MKKFIKIVASWLGIFTLPYLIRKWTEDSSFKGKITMLNISADKSVGYYLIPGVIVPSDDTIMSAFHPRKYDFNIVKTDRRDYDLEKMAEAINRHARNLGYQTIRLITVGMGDQLLALLGYVFRDKIAEDHLEIVTIDNLPTPDFLGENERKFINLIEPGLMTMRIFSGWLAEIPFVRLGQNWKSPAELAERVGTLTSYVYDYTDDDIVDCVRAVIKNDWTHSPENINEILDAAFNYDLDDDVPCRVYYSFVGKHANLTDDTAVRLYQSIFDGINWNFF